MKWRSTVESRRDAYIFFQRLNESIVGVALRAKLSVDDYNNFKKMFENIFTTFNYALLINMLRLAQIGAFTLSQITM